MAAEDIRTRRKIQQLGSSSLAISLPVDWTREQGVGKGDELILQRDETGGSLLLVPDQPSTADTVATIHADQLDPQALSRAILAQYVLGRQLITVESGVQLPIDLVESVNEIERQLMGLGIVERSKSHVDIRCSVAPGDFELPALLERLWRTESMIREDAITAFFESDIDGATRAIDCKSQAQKLFYLFLRLLFATYRNPRLNQTMGIDTGFPLIGYRSIAQDVILMVDCTCSIAEMVGEETFPGDISVDAFEKLSGTVDTALEDAQTAVANPTIESTEVARESIATLTEQLDDTQRFLQVERPEPLLALQRTHSTFRQLGVYAEDCLEVATNLAARDISNIETEYEI